MTTEVRGSHDHQLLLVTARSRVQSRDHLGIQEPNRRVSPVPQDVFDVAF